MHCAASPSMFTHHLGDIIITIKIQVYCLLPIKIICSSYFVQVFIIKPKLKNARALSLLYIILCLLIL